MNRVPLTAALLAGSALAFWLAWPKATPEASAAPERPDVALEQEEARLEKSQREEVATADAATEAGTKPAASTVPLEEEKALPPLPEGTLELLVLRNGAPLPGAGVRTALTPRDWSPLTMETEPVRRFTTDENGLVQIDELEPAVHAVAVELDGERLTQTTLNLIHDRSHRHTISIGTAAVFGTVEGWDGEIVPGAWVAASERTGDRSILNGSDRGAFQYVQADEDGYWRIDDLPPGDLMVLAWTGSFLEASLDQRSVTVLEGEQLEVLLGRIDPGADRVEGTVRTPSGAAVRNPGRGGRLWFTGPEGQLVTVPWGQDGIFQVSLSPGSWSVAASRPSNPARLELGLPIEVKGGTERMDFTLPGAQLVGEVPGAEDGERVSLTLDIANGPWGVDSTIVMDGRYEFVGLPAGEYHLNGPGKRSGVPIELEADVRHTHDL